MKCQSVRQQYEKQMFSYLYDCAIMKWFNYVQEIYSAVGCTVLTGLDECSDASREVVWNLARLPPQGRNSS